MDLAGELEADHVVFDCPGCGRKWRVWMDARGEPCPDCRTPLKLSWITYRNQGITGITERAITPECLVGAVPEVMAGLLREHGVVDPERVIQRATELQLGG